MSYFKHSIPEESWWLAVSPHSEKGSHFEFPRWAGTLVTLCPSQYWALLHLSSYWQRPLFRDQKLDLQVNDGGKKTPFVPSHMWTRSLVHAWLSLPCTCVLSVKWQWEQTGSLFLTAVNWFFSIPSVQPLKVILFLVLCLLAWTVSPVCLASGSSSRAVCSDPFVDSL